eukprot:1195958-Prorocentrum_minimum.AAC.10
MITTLDTAAGRRRSSWRITRLRNSLRKPQSAGKTSRAAKRKGEAEVRARRTVFVFGASFSADVKGSTVDVMGSTVAVKGSTVDVKGSTDAFRLRRFLGAREKTGESNSSRILVEFSSGRWSY